MDLGRRATIIDVAREADVSIKTVSRVFNDAPNVTAKTRDRVMKVATALHYHPNVVAQGLVGRRSYLIGLLYENPSPNYVVELQQGALERLQGEKYRLVVLPVGEVSAIAEKIVSLVRSAALDGVVLTPPASDHPVVLKHLAAAHFPFVRIAPTRSPDLGPRTLTDDVGGGADDDGISDLARPPADRDDQGRSEPSVERGAPARLLQCARRRRPADAARRYRAGHVHFRIRPAGRPPRLLGRSDRPTAIFAQNDDMAAGAIMAAHDLGISVPGSLSVAGFERQRHRADRLAAPHHDPSARRGHGAGRDLDARRHAREEAARERDQSSRHPGDPAVDRARAGRLTGFSVHGSV